MNAKCCHPFGNHVNLKHIHDLWPQMQDTLSQGYKLLHLGIIVAQFNLTIEVLPLVFVLSIKSVI